MSIMRKKNRTKYTDDDDDNDNSGYYNQNIDYSMSNNVKYLTPEKYHWRQHKEVPNRLSRSSIDDEIQLDKNTEYTLTPPIYRLRQIYPALWNSNENKYNHQDQQESFEDIDQNKVDISYTEYPVMMEDFILTKKPIEDDTTYYYKPKHTQVSYRYKGALNNSEVPERAMKNINEYVPQPNRNLSSNSLDDEKLYSNRPSISNNIDHRYQSFAHSNGFSPTIIPFSRTVRSTTDDNLNDFIPTSFRGQNGSYSVFYRSPLSSREYLHEKIPSNNDNYVSTELDSKYYFGKGSEYNPANQQKDYSNKDSICVSFGREVQPKPVHKQPLVEQPAPIIEQPALTITQPTPTLKQPTPTLKQPTPTLKQPTPTLKQPTPTLKQPTPTLKQPTPTIEQSIPIIQQQQPKKILKPSAFTIYANNNNNNKNNNNNIIFQEVTDIGTATDGLSSDQTQLNTSSNNGNSSFQKVHKENRESLFTKQSSRSESETYRVRQQSRSYTNDGKYDTDNSPTNQNSTRSSNNKASTNHSYINPNRPTNYNSDTINNDQSSKQSSSVQYNADESHRSTPQPSSIIRKLHETNPLANSQNTEYENVFNNTEYQPSLSKKSSAKPSTIPTKTGDGSDTIHSGLTPRRPSSTPPTDLEAETRNGSGRQHPRPTYPTTPRPPHDNQMDGNYDSDTTSEPTRRIPPSIVESKKPKLIDGFTQSEERPTRNVGTMHEPIQTRNFGNEVQPQSSSTQTSYPSHIKPSKEPFTFIERREPIEAPCTNYYPDSRICGSPQHVPDDVYYDLYDKKPHEHIERRSPSPSPPRQTTDYIYDGHYHPCYHTQYKDHSHHQPISSDDYDRSQRSRTYSPPLPPSVILHRPITIPTHDRILTPTHRTRTASSPQQRPRKPSPQYRCHTPTPSRPSRHVSPNRRPRSTTPRHRPHMHSQETDTSLDAMRKQHHTGVQYEPRSTQEKGTTPSIRTRIQPINQRSTTINSSIYYQEKYPTAHPTLTRDYDRSRQQYCRKPPNYDDYIEDYCRHNEEDEEEEEDEDETPSMHDQSTMAELIVYLDHYTQCESQPFMADRYIQTTPIVDENEQRNIPDYADESFIRQLPRSGSISIQQPMIIQPDSLPRRQPSRPSPTRPKRDGIDYTGNNLEVSLHHGLQRVSSIRDSPLLNIGTQNVLNQPIANEYVTPFETRFIYESDTTSSMRSRSDRSVLVPVLNSARTHLFTRSPPRQSKSNGNFYLSTAPPSRSTNSSLRIDIATDKS
ncbi:unnamed protein product [Rotaria sp. Silwood1]|nr:unnamed protein product [Rotaria sp. Silwood1]